MKTYQIIILMFVILGVFPRSTFSRNNRLRISKFTEFSFKEVFYNNDRDENDDMDTAETFMAALTASGQQTQATPASPTFIMMPTTNGQFVQPQVQVTQPPPVILPLVIPQQTLNNFRAQQQQQFPRLVGGGGGMPRGRLVAFRPGGGIRGRRPGGGRLIRQQLRSQALRQQQQQQQQAPQVLQPIVIQQQVPPARTTSAPSSPARDVERIPIIHQHVFQVPPALQSPIIQPQVIQQPIITPSQSLGSSYSGQTTIKELLQNPHSGPQIQMVQTSYPFSSSHSSSHPHNTFIAAPTAPTIKYAIPDSTYGSHGAGVLSNTIVVQPHMSERERKKKRRREKMIKKLQAMMD